MQKLIIFLACVAFVSCKPNKTITEYKEVVKIDTFKSEKIVERFKAVHDTLTITNPCDSSGLLSNFYSKLVLPQGRVIIRSSGGNIKATIDMDSMRIESENNYRNSKVKWIEYRDKEVIKYRVPTWVVILLIIEFLALVAWLYLKYGLNEIK
jgi:hypothetical protein